MSPEVKGTVLIPSLFALASCTHAVEMLVVSEACCEVFGISFFFEAWQLKTLFEALRTAGTFCSNGKVFRKKQM